jgi:histidinol-phosphatase
MLVAHGSGEIVVDHGVHAWDIAALKPIVEEAAGSFPIGTAASISTRPM